MLRAKHRRPVSCLACGRKPAGHLQDAARLPGPAREAILRRAIDSMGAERDDGIL